jgi:hypothetical protein
VGAEALDKCCSPSSSIFPGQRDARPGDAPSNGWPATDGTPHRAAASKSCCCSGRPTATKRFKPFEELFEGQRPWPKRPSIARSPQQLPAYFATRPLIPLEGDAKPVNLLDLLRAPAVDSPRLPERAARPHPQLWKPLLGESLERFLLIAGEILHEEELAIWMQFNPPNRAARAAAQGRRRRRRETGTQQWPPSSGAEVPVFGDPAHEYEKFSADTAWMPNTVLIAKSTYVWLAQLSKQYGRPSPPR